MDPDQPGTLLEEIGHAMASAASGEWASIRLLVTSVASMSETTLEISLPNGTLDESRSISFSGHDACDRLRRSMYQQGTGTWYNATFLLDRTGKLHADFDYENTPYEEDATSEVLLKDHRMFPRDNTHLPSWHPAKQHP